MKNSCLRCCRACLTVSVLLLSVLASSWAQSGEQAERALAAVQGLLDRGEVQPGSSLRLRVKQGNIANFLGHEHELRLEWEAKTGIPIDISVMPQMPSLAFIRSGEEIDLTIARNRELPDLFSEALIVDLDPLAQRFGLPLSRSPESGYLLPELQAFVVGKQVAIPADGDIAVLYLRRDLLEDPDHRQAYLRRYGEPLRVPRDWGEYQRQVEFFHQLEPGFYGSLEQRDEASGWMFWMPRYASARYPNQYLFDADMNPLINSPEGIAATRSYLETVAFSPPGILQAQNNYTYTLPLFANGRGYATMITLAGAKLFNRDSARVKGRVIAVPMPGHRLDGGVLRRTTLIYGNNLVIPRTSPRQELAFLFAMWLTDPEVSTRALSVSGGFSDPFRLNHFNHPALKRVYGPQVLATVEGELDQVIPAGTGLPGDTEYIRVLNRNLFLAAQGQLSAAEAMAQTEQEWRRITERYGRERQIRHWRAVMRQYPLSQPEPWE